MPSPPLQLRAGIIGLGRMGRRHLAVARQLDMRIVGLADISPDAVEAVAAMCAGDAPTTFYDADVMIDVLNLDALIVATTAPFHAAAVIRAAEKGLQYILCEKPMAASVAECQSMIEACKASGTILGVNHQMRYMEQYTRVKELIGSDNLGPLSSVVVSGSNFGLAMNGSHYFEMFRYMTGQPVTEVSAWFESDRIDNPRGKQFSDASGRVIACNSAGQGLVIDFSAQSGWGLRVCYICRNGQIQVDELSGRLEIWARDEEFRDLPTSRYGMPVIYESYHITPADAIVPTRQVWQAMLAGYNYPSGEDGLHSLQCLVAAHLSNEQNGKRVTLCQTKNFPERKFQWA